MSLVAMAVLQWRLSDGGQQPHHHHCVDPRVRHRRRQRCAGHVLQEAGRRRQVSLRRQQGLSGQHCGARHGRPAVPRRVGQRRPAFHQRQTPTGAPKMARSCPPTRIRRIRVSRWTFKTVTYYGDGGGNNQSGPANGKDGADGLSFYLVDGCVPIAGAIKPAGPTDAIPCSYTNTPQYGNDTTAAGSPFPPANAFAPIGAWGGSLAYTCTNNNGPVYNGLAGAYLGLGHR